MNKKGIWITWEIQRRNQGLSSSLQWPLYEIVYKDSRFLRYIKSLFKTTEIILKEKPEIVVAQNPSIVLSLFVLLLKPFSRYQCVIDAHNAGLLPCEGKSRMLGFLARLIQKYSDATIVTNQELANTVSKNKGTPFVLPDRLPAVPEIKPQRMPTAEFNFAYICTYSEDEPYEELIEAARRLEHDFCLYFTGNFKGKVDREKVPPNVKLTGFLSDEDYWRLISSVDVIIVLTRRDNCLVCGAYEGVSVTKPMILSRTQAIMRYFDKGCVYATPDADNLQKAMCQAFERSESLKRDVVELKTGLEKDWVLQLEKFKNFLALL